MDNIDYIGAGYNIFLGSPRFTTSLDPGFSSAEIFAISYDGNRKTGDWRYLVPDNIDIKSEYACSLSYTSTTITGE
jgi:hypothetical protein